MRFGKKCDDILNTSHIHRLGAGRATIAPHRALRAHCDSEDDDDDDDDDRTRRSGSDSSQLVDKSQQVSEDARRRPSPRGCINR